MTTHTVSTRTEWLRQRVALLEREKQLTRERDELAAARRALPWVRIDKAYTFDTDAGEASLADLFGSRSQLLVYHFMFAPQAERPCKSCSYWADHFAGAVPHLNERDVTFLAISRAPLAKLDAFKRKQGWTFDWVSQGDGDFNYDFGVSFRESEHAAGKSVYNYAPMSPERAPDAPGLSAFKKDENGAIFHTYSTFGRGIELANTTYQLLDLVPDGRNEGALAYSMSWVKYGYELAQAR